ncbi:hypothetical protein P7C70_g8952, partial [Phenoliferia sp. Uapishka_3]
PAPPAPAPLPAPPKSPEKPPDFGELNTKFKKLKEGHSKEIESLLGKIVKENEELKKANEKLKLELEVFRSSAREQGGELTKLRKEKDALVTEKVRCAGRVLTFTPTVFHLGEDGGRYAARKLRDYLRQSLPDTYKNATLIVFVFMTRKIVKDMIAEGVVKNEAELGSFILAFNNAHPLVMLIESNCPPEVIVQRERALATVLSRLPQCQTLLVGRWALDVPFAELIAPTPPKSTDSDSKSKTKSKIPSSFPAKLIFAEPPGSAIIHSTVLERLPQAIDLSRLIRTVPMISGRGSYPTPTYDPRLPFHAQHPPLCLHHYLLKDRCNLEDCELCHAYALEKREVERLRWEVGKTACPVLNAGEECVFGEDCVFAHQCPRGAACRREWDRCEFVGDGMHREKERELERFEREKAMAREQAERARRMAAQKVTKPAQDPPSPTKPSPAKVPTPHVAPRIQQKAPCAAESSPKAHFSPTKSPLPTIILPTAPTPLPNISSPRKDPSPAFNLPHQLQTPPAPSPFIVKPLPVASQRANSPNVKVLTPRPFALECLPSTPKVPVVEFFDVEGGENPVVEPHQSEKVAAAAPLSPNRITAYPPSPRLLNQGSNSRKPATTKPASAHLQSPRIKMSPLVAASTPNHSNSPRLSANLTTQNPVPPAISATKSSNSSPGLKHSSSTVIAAAAKSPVIPQSPKELTPKIASVHTAASPKVQSPDVIELKSPGLGAKAPSPLIPAEAASTHSPNLTTKPSSTHTSPAILKKESPASHPPSPAVVPKPTATSPEHTAALKALSSPPNIPLSPARAELIEPKKAEEESPLNLEHFPPVSAEEWAELETRLTEGIEAGKVFQNEYGQYVDEQGDPIEEFEGMEGWEG